jgi:hypothetical protein
MGDMIVPPWTYRQRKRGGVHGRMCIESEDGDQVSVERLFEIGKPFNIKTTSERVLCSPPIKLSEIELEIVSFNDGSFIFVRKEQCLFVRLYDGSNTDWIRIPNIKLKSWILTDCKTGEIFNNNGQIRYKWNTPFLDCKARWKQVVSFKKAGMGDCYQIIVPDLGHCFIENVCLRA